MTAALVTAWLCLGTATAQATENEADQGRIPRVQWNMASMALLGGGAAAATASVLGVAVGGLTALAGLFPGDMGPGPARLDLFTLLKLTNQRTGFPKQANAQQDANAVAILGGLMLVGSLGWLLAGLGACGAGLLMLLLPTQ